MSADPNDLRAFKGMDRFWSKVDREGPNGCWVWTAARDRHGYGRFQLDGRRIIDGVRVERRPMTFAHRASWQFLRGAIPEGLELDHLCRNPSCVNPDHLEPVTHAENVRRGNSPSARKQREGVCGRGHPQVGENVIERTDGRHECRVCKNETYRAFYAREKARLRPLIYAAKTRRDAA